MTSTEPRTAAAPSGSGGGAPIFILGMPRSGTTLIGKVFDSHPDVGYVHEPDIALRPVGLPMFIQDGEAFRKDMQRWLDQWLRLRHPRADATVPVFAKSFGAPFPVRFGYVWSRRVLYHLIARSVDERFVRPRFAARPTGHPVLKSVNMLGRVPGIRAAEPTARIIQVVRHPGAHAASVLRARALHPDDIAASALVGSATAQERGLSASDLAQSSAVQKVAWKWLCFNEDAAALGDAQVLTVAYEDVVNKPEDAFERLFRFCGLDFHASVERFLHQTFSSDGEGGRYSLRQNRNRALYGWRDELDGQQVREIEEIVSGARVMRWYGADNA